MTIKRHKTRKDLKMKFVQQDLRLTAGGFGRGETLLLLLGLLWEIEPAIVGFCRGVSEFVLEVGLVSDYRSHKG